MKTGKIKDYLQSYIKGYRYALIENGDGLARDRRHEFWGNMAHTTFSAMIGGSFYSTLLLILTQNCTTTQKTKAVALISLIATAGGFFQLLAPVILERLRKRKVLLLVLYGLAFGSQIIGYPLAVAVPQTFSWQLGIFAATAGVSAVSSALYSPGLSAWHIGIIPNERRPDYFATSNILSTIVTAGLALVLGIYFDYFAENGQALLGILILRGVSLLLFSLVIYLFAGMKEPDYSVNPSQKVNLIEIFKAPLTHKPFMLALAVYFFYVVVTGLPGSYYSMYILDEAGANFTYTSLGWQNAIGIPFAIAVMPIWKKLIQKYGWMKPMAASLFLYGICYFMNGLVTADTRFWYYVSNVHCQCVAAGMSLGWSNYPYSHAPKKMLSAALACYSVTGTLGSLLSVKVSEWFMLATEGKILHFFGLALENRAYVCIVTFLGVSVTSVLLLLLNLYDIRFAKKHPDTEQSTGNESKKSDDEGIVVTAEA